MFKGTNLPSFSVLLRSDEGVGWVYRQMSHAVRATVSLFHDSLLQTHEQVPLATKFRATLLKCAKTKFKPAETRSNTLKLCCI